MFDFEREIGVIFGNGELEDQGSARQGLSDATDNDPNIEFSNKYKFSSKDADGWFLNETKDAKSIRVKTEKINQFEQGKIYVFKYKAESADRLAYWDKHPIVLIFGSIETSTGKVYIGINLSWYPLKARLYFLKQIRLLYKAKFDDSIKKKPGDAKGQPPIVLDLYKLKMLLDDKGFSFGMRMYKTENLLNPVSCVCYEDWKNIVRMDLPKKYPQLVTTGGFSIFRIYLDYLLYVRKMLSTKSAHREMMTENKKRGRYILKR